MHKCIMEPSHEYYASINTLLSVRIPDNKTPFSIHMSYLRFLRAALRLLPYAAQSETNFTQPPWEPQQILHSQGDDFR